MGKKELKTQNEPIAGKFTKRLKKKKSFRRKLDQSYVLQTYNTRITKELSQKAISKRGNAPIRGDFNLVDDFFIFIRFFFQMLLFPNNRLLRRLYSHQHKVKNKISIQIMVVVN